MTALTRRHVLAGAAATVAAAVFPAVAVADAVPSGFLPGRSLLSGNRAMAYDAANSSEEAKWPSNWPRLFASSSAANEGLSTPHRNEGPSSSAILRASPRAFARKAPTVPMAQPPRSVTFTTRNSSTSKLLRSCSAVRHRAGRCEK